MIIHHGCSPSSEPCHVFPHKFGKQLPASTLSQASCYTVAGLCLPSTLHRSKLVSGVHRPDLSQIVCNHQTNKNTYFSFRFCEGDFWGDVLVKCVKLSHGTKMSTLWHQWSHLVDVRNQHGWWNETHMESINCLAMIHPQLCLLCGVWWWKVAKDPRCRKSHFGCRGSLRLQKKYVVGLKVASSC